MSSYQDSYGPVTARFYDAAYAHLAEGPGDDVPFYRRLAEEAGGPVLELGCGTGRVLLELARRGIACTGVDASEEMLAVLARKARDAGLPDLRLAHARMQEFDLGERFSLVYCAFRGFQHLHDVSDQLACLSRVRRHLRPQAVFAFDVFRPRPEWMVGEEDPEAEDVRFEQDGEQVVRHVAVRRFHAEQVLRVRMRYERRIGDRVLGDETETFHLRWFHRFELEHLMHRAGFSRVRILGDFDGNPVHASCPAFVVVAS